MGVGMQRVLEELLGRRMFHDLAPVHHRDTVTEVADDVQVMGDEQVAQPQLVLQILQEIDDLGLDGDVQGRDRLVADDERRIDTQGPGDPDALALAAAELVGVPVDGAGRHADTGEQLFRARRRSGAPPHPGHAQALADGLPHAHAGVERTVRVLEDDLDLFAQRLHLRIRDAAEVDAVEHDAAGIARQQL